MTQFEIARKRFMRFIKCDYTFVSIMTIAGLIELGIIVYGCVVAYADFVGK